MAIDKNGYKIISIFSTLVLGLVAALLPLKIKGNQRLLSLGNACGAGVLLAAAIVHLFNEAVYHLEGASEWFPPLAFFLCGLGAILTLSVEQITKAITEANGGGHAHSHGGHGHSHGGAGAGANAHSHCSSSSSDVALTDVPPAVMAELSPAALATLRAHIKAKTAAAAAAGAGDGSVVDVSYSANASANKSEALEALIPSPSAVDEAEDEYHGHSHGLPVATGSILSSLVLWFALSFHSVMEGIAMGASDESFTSIFIAIIAHKGLESFALGASIVRSGVSRGRHLFFCVAFALMTPVGVAIGMAVQSYAAHDSIVSAVLAALASGTFLFVGIVEVIMPEFERKQDRLVKLLLLIVGFLAMSLLAKWA